MRQLGERFPDPNSAAAMSTALYVIELHEPAMGQFMARVAWRSCRVDTEEDEDEGFSWSQNLELGKFTEHVEAVSVAPTPGPSQQRKVKQAAGPVSELLSRMGSTA